jgi:hypothetical protein
MNHKMPPREKIHEALSAIADKRITIKNNEADVVSSDGSKQYLVTWNDNIYSANDNATFWQNYPGYPVIAVLLINDNITYNHDILAHFKDVNWRELNKQFNNDYTLSVKEVYKNIDSKDIVLIEKEIDNIYQQLNDLDIIIKRGKVFPPK